MIYSKHGEIKVRGCYFGPFFMFSKFFLQLDSHNKHVLHYYDETSAKTGLKIGLPLLQL